MFLKFEFWSYLWFICFFVSFVLTQEETYRSRNRRYADGHNFDVQDVEDYIVSEFGPNACVFERACAQYAVRAQAKPKPDMNWPELFSQYQRSANQDKEFFLLSVFLGDIVGSPQLCLQLGKRRSCGRH